MRRRKLSAHPAALHNRVLNAWPTTSAGDIAKREKISPNTVMGVVRGARVRGDERAVHKPHQSRKPGWFTTGCDRTLAMARLAARASVEARRKTAIEKGLV